MEPDDAFDLLVVGGGINGAGIARDAAMRGLSVCLLEARDYGAGTSAKSSMLAHGGLRYLEQFEMGLVHEALQERERMFRQAPHLVRPLRFIYPIYPHIASRRTVRAGLFLYDVLSHGKSVPKREYLKPAAVAAELPGINRSSLIGGAAYHDGQWRSVERFVQELVVDARRHGAHCHNHVRVERLVVEDGAARGAVVRPDPDVPEAALWWQEAGHSAIVAGDDGTWQVRARAVINAAGPWVDRVLADAGIQEEELIRGTKGSHIAVPRFVDTALIIRANDGRTFFILPWQEHCLIGTTDLDHDGDPEDAVASPEEIAYLQEGARWYFPDAPLDNVRFTYAGVRPLVHQEGLTESNVTRRHVLHPHSVAGLWSLQGGKLTTYRHLAEEAVGAVVQHLERRDARDCPTRDALLPGGTLDWEAFREAALRHAKRRGLDDAPAATLVDDYGVRWEAVLAAGGEDGHETVPGSDVAWCAIDHATRHEQATTLCDVMFRRTRLGLQAGLGRNVAKGVLRRMAKHLGWSASRRRAEMRAFEAECRRRDPHPTAKGRSRGPWAVAE